VRTSKIGAQRCGRRAQVAVGAQQYVHVPGHVGGVRHVDHGVEVEVLRRRPLADVLRHAHDGHPLAGPSLVAATHGVGNPDALADCGGPREKRRSEPFVDDRGAPARLAFAGLELTPSQGTSADRAEVLSADRDLSRPPSCRARRLAAYLDVAHAAARERRHVRECHLRAATRGEPLFESPVERDALFRRGVDVGREIKPQADEPRRVHAGVDPAHRHHALHHGHRSGQQHEGEGNLADDECAAEAPSVTATGGRPSRIVQHLDQAGAGGLQRRQQAEEDGRAEAHRCQVQEHTDVERKAQPVGRMRVGRVCPEHPDANHRQAETTHPGNRREQQALYQ